MPKEFLKNRFFASIVLGTLLTIFSAISISIGLFDSIHNQFSNSLYTVDNPTADIVIVAIDDKSTENPPTGLGRYNQWSRKDFQKMLSVLNEQKPKVVAFDILFHTTTSTVSKDELLKLQSEIEKTRDKNAQYNQYEQFVSSYSNSLRDPVDLEFANELKKTPGLVLAAYYRVIDDLLIDPIFMFQANASLGITSGSLDEQGTIRDSQLFFEVGDQKQIFDNFAVAVVKKYLGESELVLPKFQDNKMLINFFGEPYTYKMVSFIDVINGNFAPDTFKNKIVLIGATAFKDIHDEVITPRSNTTPMAGIELWANEIQTILDKKFLYNQSSAATIITIAIISLLLSLALNYLGIVTSILLTIAALAGYTLAAHFAYGKGLILNMIYPYIAIVLTYLGSWVYKYFIADRHKRELKSAFGHYVSKELVEQISKNPDLVKLGGENKEITVFFSDIEGSTTLSEQIAIEQWVAQINEYFTVMEDVVMRSGGTLDKYEGDAIMGFWNAPISQADHVKRAHAAALQMEISLRKLHTKWQQEGKPLINIRIGVNTGPALVGNFGSKNRLDYTVMGDTINTASRLESAANKSYNTRICISGPLQPEFSYRELDNVLLPGKKEAVKLYELYGLASAITVEQQAILTNYAAGLAAYRQKNWAQALAEFEKNPQDGPSEVMKKRCQLLIGNALVEGLDLNSMVFSIAHK